MKDIVIGIECGNRRSDNGWEDKYTIINGKVKKVMIPTIWEEYSPPKPILDNKEREYLAAVIKPWRDKINYIKKEEWKCKELQFIDIDLIKDEIDVMLPYFNSNTMYKGMEIGKEYSLKELGL